MNETSLKRLILAGVATCMLSAPSYGQTYVDIESDVGTFQPVTLGENISLDPCGSQFTQQVDGSSAPQVSVGSVCSNTSNAQEVSFHYLISSGATTFALRFGRGFDGVIRDIRDKIATPSGGTFSSISGSSVGISNTPYSLATGAGSLFSTAGTYVISLIASVRQNNSSVININGSSYAAGTDRGLQLTGTGIDVNGVMVGNFNGLLIGNLGTVNSHTNPADADGRRNLSISQTTLVVNDVVSVPEPSGLLLLLGGLLFGWRLHREKLYNSVR